MRSDMTKVIGERPRVCTGYARDGERREWQRIPIEDHPARERIKDRLRGCPKQTSQLLGPLRRFLGSNVGRPWDVVFSEICAGTTKGSPARASLLVEVDRTVERNVILIDRIPCYGPGSGHGTPLRWRRGSVYVCPRTGLLRRVREGRGKRSG